MQVSCPADVNVAKKAAEKLENYGPLIRTLQLTHSNYKFSLVPIINGALGTVPKDLHKTSDNLTLTKKCPMILYQSNSTKSTVKICKTFMNFKK